MRYYFILISFLSFLVSCERSANHETQVDTSTIAQKDSTPTLQTDSLIQSYKRTIRDSVGMLSVLVEHSAILYKQADTTSAILQELSYHEHCFVPIEDILEMKSIVRCIHDTTVGYVRRKDLFKTVSSALSDKKYIVWLASEDSVKVIRINTKKRLIEDQLNLENYGASISANLLNADSWSETSAVIQVEMSPEACEETSFAHVIDYKDKLKLLITTSSYGDEGGSSYSELLFKKGLLLHVVSIDEFQGDEHDSAYRKEETAKFKWNGDSLVAVGIKK